MKLCKNPFHILGASPRDDRRRIMELADERSLLFDPDRCMQARSDLLNPAKRLFAEMAWMPGVNPKRVAELLSMLKSSPRDLRYVDRLNPITRANLLASGFSKAHDLEPGETAGWALQIANEFEKIDPEGLLVLVNEDRNISGFPEVTDLSAVEEAIKDRRRYYREAIISVMANLPMSVFVKSVTTLVEFSTDNGATLGPILVSDIVDSYKDIHQDILEKGEEDIRAVVDAIWFDAEGVSDAYIESMVNDLIGNVEKWDEIAQPIQISSKSRGLDHIISHRVSDRVRQLMVHMISYHGILHFSIQLTKMMEKVFAEVREVAERASKDASTLTIIQRRVMKLSSRDIKKINDLGWAKKSTLQVHQALLKRPTANAKWLSQETGISYATINKALGHLERLGIVEEITGQKRNRRFRYTKYMKIIERGTKSLAE